MRRQTRAEEPHTQRWPDDLDRRTLTYSDGTPYEVRVMWSGSMAMPRRPDLMLEIRQGSRPTASENARRYTSEEETW
jgi:hypothetical protein